MFVWIGIGVAAIAGLVLALIVISFFSTWLKATGFPRISLKTNDVRIEFFDDSWSK